MSTITTPEVIAQSWHLVTATFTSRTAAPTLDVSCDTTDMGCNFGDCPVLDHRHMLDEFFMNNPHLISPIGVHLWVRPVDTRVVSDEGVMWFTHMETYAVPVSMPWAKTQDVLAALRRFEDDEPAEILASFGVVL